MRMEQFGHVFCIEYFFLNFCFCKKISGDSITLTQKEKFPKKYPNFFFESTLNFGGLSYCGFSFIPPEGLHGIISVNPWLLLPTKFVMAYARN